MNILSMQEKLKALSYDVDLSNVFDTKTDWAMRFFCKKNGELKRLLSADAIPGVVGNETVFYSMKDELWANHPYYAAESDDIEVVGNSACGPTSMAIALSNLLRKAVLPPVLADWSNAHGYRDPKGIDGTSDDFFPAVGAVYGCKATMVPIACAEDFLKVTKGIDRGAVAICNVVPGSPFTNCGHYNTIAAIEDGRIVIADPVPKNNLLPHYTVEEWIEGKWARHCILIEKMAMRV